MRWRRQKRFVKQFLQIHGVAQHMPRRHKHTFDALEYFLIVTRTGCVGQIEWLCVDWSIEGKRKKIKSNFEQFVVKIDSIQRITFDT